MSPSEPGCYDAPVPGDIAWCRFPQDGVPKPGPKPRPALVLSVGEQNDNPVVIVTYGTSQKTGDLRAGEFAILPANATAYAAAGLGYPTKFNLGVTFELDYNDVWFGVPPGAPHGQTPKLGVLHPSLMRGARAAKALKERVAKLG